MTATTKCRVDIVGRECTKCGEWKPWGEFQNHPKGLNGKMARCRTCKTQDKYDWIARNAESHADYTAEYRRTGGFAAALRKRYWVDPEAARERNRIYRAADAEKYRALAREYARKRRYSKISSGVFPDTEWKRLLNRFGGLCAYCRTSAAEHREHVIPVSRGGYNTVGNILPSCASCNYSKHVLTIMEWRLSGRAPEAMRPINRSKRNG